MKVKLNSNCEESIVDGGSTPRFYKKGIIIVRYIGKIIADLCNIWGKQFTGAK